MRLQQLRYFVAVAERRHFTKAAADLAVAQPSVSKQIGRLEAELGTPLFHRMRGNIALTPAGEVLLAWARRVLADVASAQTEVRALAGLGRGRLAVGATPSLTVTLLAPALARYRASYPGIELALTEAGSRDLVRDLERGELDIALVILPVEHDVLETMPLLREELVVAAPRGHPLAKREALAVSDLRGVPLVMFRDGYDLRAATLAACRAAGFEATLAIEGGEMDGVLQLAAAGLGVAVVPSMVLRRGVDLRAVRLRPRLVRTVGFAHRRDRRLSRAAQAFVEVACALVRERDFLRRMPRGIEVLEAAPIVADEPAGRT
ncbi:MAG: LysR family transcriptional regulator [Candidatus Limnocylindria bacterium]